MGLQPAEKRGQTLLEMGIRPALVLGLGLTVGTWLLAYWYFSVRIASLEARQTELSGRYELAQDLVGAARSDVLASAVASRNALLDDDNAAGRHQEEVDSAFAAIDAALDRYETVFPGEPALDSPVQRQQLARLRQQVLELNATTRQVLGDERERAAPGNALNLRITPRREAAMATAEAILRLNREGFIRQQSQMSLVYKGVQQSILQALAIALLTSLGIAVALSRHAGRLESRVREQRTRDLDNALNLQRLTARLVTAQEEERRHIARELHDEVGQVFTIVKLALRDAQKAVVASGASPEMLEEARLVSDRALQTVRDLSRLLHPSILDDMGLSVAIDAHLQGFGRRHDISVSAEYTGMEERLTPDIELIIYRTVQEALTNVARHAQATACRVELRRTEHQVEITIQDTGVGFDAVAASRPGPQRGLGLLGMQERVTQIGGEMVLESARGRGTRVFATLPVSSVPVEHGALDLTEALTAAATEGTHA
jgi:signal transduction histidine kinase